MNALVVYASQFGNTEKVARAIGSALATHGPTEVRPVAEVGGIPPDTDLLVVGGPTQGHGIDKTMKSFLAGLSPAAVADVPVAAFDTRLRWPVLLSGSAGRRIARQLSKMGGQLVAEPDSFLVGGGQGPLIDGELDRAMAWAEHLAGAAIDARAARDRRSEQ